VGRPVGLARAPVASRLAPPAFFSRFGFLAAVGELGFLLARFSPAVFWSRFRTVRRAISVDETQMTKQEPMVSSTKLQRKGHSFLSVNKDRCRLAGIPRRAAALVLYSTRLL